MTSIKKLNEAREALKEKMALADETTTNNIIRIFDNIIKYDAEYNLKRVEYKHVKLRPSGDKYIHSLEEWQMIEEQGKNLRSTKILYNLEDIENIQSINLQDKQEELFDILKSMIREQENKNETLRLKIKKIEERNKLLSSALDGIEGVKHEKN